MRHEGARFLQSAGDFPVQVALGGKAPSWELSRWGVPGLRFIPPEDEGFALRGNRRRLVYKGRRRSHRFTILGDIAFEYDIILEREPESSVITLLIEGAEGFDFFRQPDGCGPAILQGSYAVYKKAGAISSPAYPVGTGKLCHIHRPQIIDARGRRTWGDLRIDRGLLTIRIPEEWLAGAAYPVTVDPVVGSGTVGAYRGFEYISQEYYDYYLEDKAADPATQLEWYTDTHAVELSSSAVFNRYTAPSPLQGTCTASVYVDAVHPSMGTQYTLPYAVLPLLYDDYYTTPANLLAYNSTLGHCATTVSEASRFTPRWVQSALTVNGTVPAGTAVWFGYWGHTGTLRFDYGAPLLQTYDVGIDYAAMGEYSSLYDMAADYGFDDISYCEDMYSGSYHEPNVYPGARYDLKVSMYLSVPAAYTRTVTQGVSLTDTRKRAGSYKRSAAQTVRGTTEAKGFAGLYRRIVQSVTGAVSLKRPLSLVRSVIEHIRGVTEMYRSRGLSRNCRETIRASSETKRSQGFNRKAYGGVGGTDAISFPVLFLRSLPDTARLSDSKTHWGAYIRGLRTAAASIAEARHSGMYYRKQTERVRAAGIPFRNLFMFIRLVTTSLVRDFLLRRFLKSNEDLVLKSPVCREITLESTIH